MNEKLSLSHRVRPYFTFLMIERNNLAVDFYFITPHGRKSAYVCDGAGKSLMMQKIKIDFQHLNSLKACVCEIILWQREITM
jgi:hypothetical protein